MNPSGRRTELKCKVPREGSPDDGFPALARLIADCTQGSRAVTAALDWAASEIEGFTRM
jgi:hypothetical protein